MNYNLFLDDARFPVDAGNYIMPVDDRYQYFKEHWIICRNYDEFVWYIKHNGLPKKVSFDHDLADEHYAEIHYYTQKVYEEFFKNCKEKTGLDAAKWLVDYCMDNNLELPEYYVHSMNPVGAKNIRTYLENFKKHEQTIFNNR